MVDVVVGPMFAAPFGTDVDWIMWAVNDPLQTIVSPVEQLKELGEKLKPPNVIVYTVPNA
ncbi:MAG: hypothetical protein ACHQM6_02860 [Candidatus Kapaibacterium sp.]